MTGTEIASTLGTYPVEALRQLAKDARTERALTVATFMRSHQEWDLYTAYTAPT